MKKIILMAAALLCAMTATQAQEAGSLLDINADTRTAAMGDVTTAAEGSAFSVFNNAAAAPLSNKKFQIGAYYSPWASGLTKDLEKKNMLMGVGAYFTAGERHSIQIGFRYLQSAGSVGMDANGNPTKDTFAPKDMTIDLGYGIRIGESLGVGVAAHYINSNLGVGASGSAVAVDLGVQYRLGLGEKANLDLGVKAANIGSKLKYGEGEGSALPAKATLGAVFTVQPSDAHSIKVGVDAGYKFMGYTGFVAGVGAEYMAFNTVAARVGYHMDGKAKMNYATVGLGVRVVDMIQADFTYYLASGAMKNTFRAGLSFRF
ncbi:MAG: PorV/PorQ family protein [Rikenellaceae bacterium]|nr:PorV/PorQ family protein [Rikenellaceae bacterium]